MVAALGAVRLVGLGEVLGCDEGETLGFRQGGFSGALVPRREPCAAFPGTLVESGRGSPHVRHRGLSSQFAAPQARQWYSCRAAEPPGAGLLPECAERFGADGW